MAASSEAFSGGASRVQAFSHVAHSSDEVILKPTGSQLTVEFLEENSFSVPILVLKKDGLGMTLPSPSFTVRDVEHYVGKHHRPS